MDGAPFLSKILDIGMNRPESLNTITIRRKTGCGSMYITITPKESEYKEIFAILGKSGGCPACNVSALTRMITVSSNYGTPIKVIVKQLKGIRCPFDSNYIPSCPEAIAQVIEEVWPETNGGNDEIQIENP